jgi:hypothetical protein
VFVSLSKKIETHFYRNYHYTPSTKMIRLTAENAHMYVNNIIQYTSRNTTKYAVITRTSPKTVYIQEIVSDPAMLLKKVPTNDLKKNLQLVTRKIYVLSV